MAGVGAWVLRTRWLVRAPIAAYRIGLGWMFGSRILMLEHRGRSSGRQRYVCLEVVEHPSADVYVVVSGFGERAQWYRNLRADPRCRVNIGTTRHAAATARFLSEAESAATLARYAERHPRDWQYLRSTIERAVDHPVEGLPMVELRFSP